MEKARGFIGSRRNPSSSLPGITNRVSEEDKKGFEIASECILECICWLTKKGLTLRGHREDIDNEDLNSGNFWELVRFVSSYVI